MKHRKSLRVLRRRHLNKDKEYSKITSKHRLSDIYTPNWTVKTLSLEGLVSPQNKKKKIYCLNVECNTSYLSNRPLPGETKYLP